MEFDGEAPLPMRARVVCNRYAPGYRSVSVRIQKNQLFRDVYPRNVCLPRINNTIHREVFVCRGQKSTAIQCMTHYHTAPNAPTCHVLPHIAHTVHNAITTFYINIHFNRSQNVVHALRKDAICCVLLRYALLCIFGGQFAVAYK